MDGLDELSDSGGCATARHPVLHIIISHQVRCHYSWQFRYVGMLVHQLIQGLVQQHVNITV